MRPYVAPALSSVAIGTPIALDYMQNSFNVGLSFNVVSGTNTSSIQFSLDDPNATYATDYNTDATWYDTSIAGATANEAGVLTTPCRAVRHNMTANSSGSAQLTVVQGHSV